MAQALLATLTLFCLRAAARDRDQAWAADLIVLSLLAGAGGVGAGVEARKAYQDFLRFVPGDAAVKAQLEKL